MLKLLVVFEKDEDGWEVASCPTLPGAKAALALKNIHEAIRGYLASMREHDSLGSCQIPRYGLLLSSVGTQSLLRNTAVQAPSLLRISSKPRRPEVRRR